MASNKKFFWAVGYSISLMNVRDEGMKMDISQGGNDYNLCAMKIQQNFC